jgi:hypothetical protein
VGVVRIEHALQCSRAHVTDSALRTTREHRGGLGRTANRQRTDLVNTAPQHHDSRSADHMVDRMYCDAACQQLSPRRDAVLGRNDLAQNELKSRAAMRIPYVRCAPKAL